MKVLNPYATVIVIALLVHQYGAQFSTTLQRGGNWLLDHTEAISRTVRAFLKYRGFL